MSGIRSTGDRNAELSEPATPLDAPVRVEADGDPRAPANWSTRACWGVVVVIGYLLSPLPLGVMLDLMPRTVSRPAFFALSVAYKPLSWLYGQNRQVRDFYDWYESLLDA